MRTSACCARCAFRGWLPERHTLSTGTSPSAWKPSLPAVPSPASRTVWSRGYSTSSPRRVTRLRPCWLMGRLVKARSMGWEVSNLDPMTTTAIPPDTNLPPPKSSHSRRSAAGRVDRQTSKITRTHPKLGFWGVGRARAMELSSFDSSSLSPSSFGGGSGGGGVPMRFCSPRIGSPSAFTVSSSDTLGGDDMPQRRSNLLEEAVLRGKTLAALSKLEAVQNAATEAVEAGYAAQKKAEAAAQRAEQFSTKALSQDRLFTEAHSETSLQLKQIQNQLQTLAKAASQPAPCKVEQGVQTMHSGEPLLECQTCRHAPPPAVRTSPRIAVAQSPVPTVRKRPTPNIPSSESDRDDEGDYLSPSEAAAGEDDTFFPAAPSASRRHDVVALGFDIRGEVRDHRHTLSFLSPTESNSLAATPARKKLDFPRATHHKTPRGTPVHSGVSPTACEVLDALSVGEKARAIKAAHRLFLETDTSTVASTIQKAIPQLSHEYIMANWKKVLMGWDTSRCDDSPRVEPVPVECSGSRYPNRPRDSGKTIRTLEYPSPRPEKQKLHPTDLAALTKAIGRQRLHHRNTRML
eukprot:Sspe_Gene.19048::Locus_6907_Transcript_1_2_Confidence_0.667_Length_4221::g.19048::m.19048